MPKTTDPDKIRDQLAKARADKDEAVAKANAKIRQLIADLEAAEAD